MCFTESDEVCAAFGKWPCFVILHTLYKYTLRAHYLFYKWMCATWDTWWSHQRRSVWIKKYWDFMSMPFAKYARMTIVSDSADCRRPFCFARAYNKFHIYRTLFIYGTTCAFENININSLGFIEKRIIIFICIPWEMKMLLVNLLASSDFTDDFNG